jgi:hypothetical protein
VSWRDIQGFAGVVLAFAGLLILVLVGGLSGWLGGLILLALGLAVIAGAARA